MNNPIFVILWDGAPLITIKVPNSLIPPTVMLDTYAKNFAFERKRLRGAYIDCITWEEFNTAEPM